MLKCICVDRPENNILSAIARLPFKVSFKFDVQNIVFAARGAHIRHTIIRFLLNSNNKTKIIYVLSCSICGGDGIYWLVVYTYIFMNFGLLEFYNCRNVFYSCFQHSSEVSNINERARGQIPAMTIFVDTIFRRFAVIVIGVVTTLLRQRYYFSPNVEVAQSFIDSV